MLIGEKYVLRFEIAMYDFVLIVDCGNGLKDVACIEFEERFSHNTVELGLIP
jgi:hypothetical protein